MEVKGGGRLGFPTQHRIARAPEKIKPLPFTIRHAPSTRSDSQGLHPGAKDAPRT